MKTTTKPRGLLLPGGTAQIRLLLSIAERGEGVLVVPINPPVESPYCNDAAPVIDSRCATWHHDYEYERFVWRDFPYRIGETRWLKESFALSVFDPEGGTSADDPENWDTVHRVGHVEGGGWTDAYGKRIPPAWRAAQTMPPWASRLTITFRSVTAKQLRDVSEAEAQAAGALPDGWEDDIPGGPVCTGFVGRHTLESMWPSLHTSPFDPAAWVWVYGVEVCRK